MRAIVLTQIIALAALASGIVTPVGAASSDDIGDGGPAIKAKLHSPKSVAVGPDGALYICEWEGLRVRKVDRAGIITTVAGNGKQGYSGDGGPATDASLYWPYGIALGPDGSLYIADRNNSRIRKVDPAGIITTVAGNGKEGYSGDGGPATKASLYWPEGVAVGPDGTVYIADTWNVRVRKVTPDGIITKVAGNGADAYAGDGGPAIKASLNMPFSLAVSGTGSVYIADTFNMRIRKVDPKGIITTVAGGGQRLRGASGCAATQVILYPPFDVALGPDGSLYIAGANDWIRKVNLKGIITTVAGSGKSGYSGDGGAATKAKLCWPQGLAVGPDGSVYIADRANHRVRKVDRKGIITTVAGRGK